MHGQRKADHIRINLEKDVGFKNTTAGFERYRFEHNALPELDLAAVDTGTEFFGKHLRAPLLISSMTGGTAEAGRINRRLAEAAQACGVAMGVGSQRAALEDPALAASFKVRKYAPDILLFANLGAVQLNYGYGVNECRRAVEMIDADALILHFNALQEAVQPEGDTNFSGLLARVETVCAALGVPVIAKEVGWGFSEGNVRQLVDAGVAAIDVAGAGGTSWSQVEMHRAPTERHRRVAAAFMDWGIPTTEAILAARRVVSDMPVIASGGLRSGVDVAKSLALGANLGGMAGPFLRAATQSVAAVVQEIDIVQTELRVTMFATGAGTLSALRDGSKLRKIGG